MSTSPTALGCGPYETFAITEARIADHKFYGVRSFRLSLLSQVELDCGYLQGIPLPTGELILRLPARDKAGGSCQAVIHTTVAYWDLKIEGDHFQTTYTYIGYLKTRASDRIDIESIDGQRVKLVSL